jgi:hypothetical protein
MRYLFSLGKLRSRGRIKAKAILRWWERLRLLDQALELRMHFCSAKSN